MCESPGEQQACLSASSVRTLLDMGVFEPMLEQLEIDIETSRRIMQTELGLTMLRLIMLGLEDCV